MAKKPKFDEILEYALFEALRRGLSAHFGSKYEGAFDEFMQLLTLVQFALGGFSK